MRILFLKPFERYQESTLLIIGGLAIFSGSFIASILHARFDGVLDMHFVESVSYMDVLMDNLINVFALLLFLFPLSKYINANSRLIDILNSILIARIPYYLLPVFNVYGILDTATEEFMTVLSNPELIRNVSMNSYVVLGVFTILSLAIMGWSIALLYNGFKTATNSKNKSHIWFFALAIILAEVLSKYLISFIN